MAPSKRPHHAVQAGLGAGTDESSGSSRPQNNTKTSGLSVVAGGKKSTNGVGVSAVGGAVVGQGGNAAGPDGVDTAVAADGPSSAWKAASMPALLAYRYAYRLSVPAPYASPLHAAVLGNRGIARRSPTAVAKMLARRARRHAAHTGGGEDDNVDGATQNGEPSTAAAKGKTSDTSLRDTPVAAAGAGAGVGGSRSKDAFGKKDAGPKGVRDRLPGAREELVATVRRHFNAMPAEETVVLANLLYRVGTQNKVFRHKIFPKRDVIPGRVGGAGTT